MDDDDEDVMVYERPLDLGLALDGHDPDDSEDDANEQDGQELPQDGTGDRDGAEDDGTTPSATTPQNRAGASRGRLQLAKRGDGEWRLVGEPVPDTTFNEMGWAHTFAENRNKRDFGQKFDWLANPPKAWLAVRAGQLGVLRVNQPVPVEGGGAGAVAPRDGNQFCWVLRSLG